MIWQVDSGIVLNYMEDAGLGISYAVMVSEYSKDLSQLMSRIIEGGLDVYTDQDLLDAVTSAPSSRGQATALVRAGIGAPAKLDNRYSRLFIDSVRLYGVLAIGYAEWAPFRELLEAVSEQDEDVQVRTTARSLMEAFDVSGIGDAE
ncbi:hypothetical protein ACIQPP_49560 [Streptomyces violaceusniger]|uniref:hypothetical protein n=1 Tax=Streptomyces violaceusniger TaxID=68280 RepID=UPI00099851AD|nr:hypothetical protein [Streptomyces hygroscopicus]